MTSYRLWSSTSGPDAADSYTPGSAFISGLVFCVTGEAWFEGYWWWVASGGSPAQGTSPVKCALWNAYTNTTGTLVPGSVATSDTLIAGQWNWIPLASPIPLSLGGSSGMSPPVNGGDTGYGMGVYIAAIGCNGPFPDTTNYWGASPDPGSNGITAGPLTAYSDTSGTMPSPSINISLHQGVFSTAGSDPSTTMPTSQSGTDNFWVDVQVSDYSGAPQGASLRLWPNLVQPNPGTDGDNTVAVSGTAFTLSRSCSLDKIWMFSPPGAAGFPTRTGIWNTDTQAEVSGTDNSSPSWLAPGGGAATAGGGWAYVDYSSAGVTLPAGNYAVTFYNGDGALIYAEAHNYFFAGTDPVGGASVGGPGHNGVSWGGGILTAPKVASGPTVNYDSGGTGPGNGVYRPAVTAWGYPSNFESSSDWGESRWADVEVTPVTTGGGEMGGRRRRIYPVLM